MIQLLSGKYKQAVAWGLFGMFYLQLLLPLYVKSNNPGYYYYHNSGSRLMKVAGFGTGNKASVTGNGKLPAGPVKLLTGNKKLSPSETFIGGPTAPEASSFKAVGSNNLVNVATGDFSYSIPLLDVGGYPVNLFYSGGITMDQDASWVGLGWNINPGTVNRNMRGVPDDFNGTDELIQTQNVKPNRTWGGDLAFDFEYVGIKAPKIGIGGSLGFSFNNYLGPALELGNRVSLSISTAENVKAEKSATMDLGVTASLGTKLSSRSGLTFSPSLNAKLGPTDSKVGTGVGLSTSYNSRIGIKELTITAQTKFLEMGDILGDNLKGSTTISFAKPSYIPTLRMPMQNANYSGQLELGVGFYGFRASLTALGYYSESKVPEESREVRKPLVGYIYSEKAKENANAVMDFNRLNDAEVTPNTPIISAPQYNYDIFSIQGEGTGGSIRAYRGDMGFVRDNVTISKDKNISVGLDMGVPFHIGFNWNTINTPTRVGGWEGASNTLLQTQNFKPGAYNTSFENVYFRNPGETTVSNPDMIDRVGGDNLVRLQLGGSNAVPRLESVLEQFNKQTLSAKPLLPIKGDMNLKSRDKRTQVVSMLNAADAAKVGLDSTIRNYSGTFDLNNNIQYDNIPRVGGIRKAHHISEISVLEQSGMRYVYGIPVYSVTQKDFTFSVANLPDTNNLVTFSDNETTVNSPAVDLKSKMDGYVMSQETPAYASSFLLTGLLSPDYIDVTGNGITEDDLGTAVKFNYSKSADLHKWRTPRNNSTGAKASFNEGVRTEKKDNKAIISYGEREAWYLQSIESKSMVAIFTTDYSRNDGKGVVSALNGSINNSEQANKRLVKIDLYTKSEIKTKGISNARPLKTVHFVYDSSLCKGSPDSKSGGGKLTLKSVYFSYNGMTRQVKNKYIFNYGNLSSQADNPSFKYNSSDRWGTYKPKTDPVAGTANNPSGLSNIDFPYTIDNKAKNDVYAGAWSLKKILLPSGGQMEIQYESDAYGYVQNRRACNMMSIYGLGKTTNYGTDNGLYNNGLATVDNEYVYIKLDKPLQSTNSGDLKKELYAKYLDGINQKDGKKQLAIKMLVNMPKGYEPLTVYPEYDDYGVCANSTNKDYIYIHLKKQEGKSPLAKSAIGFLTENIPGQAFEGYEVEVDGIEAFVKMAGGMLSSLKNAFKNVDEQMRSAPKGRTIDLSKSFIRLANPDRNKFGGGHRVKKVLIRDNWNKMTGQYNSVYGQEYDYTTTEKIFNKDTVISSGVASYEPGIGSEENPFREIVSFSNKLPLASAQYGAIEMPLLEGLYSSPNVVYSKVTVRSIHRKGTHGDSSLRSAIGRQVSEFYTARDYPSFSSYTPMNSMEYKKNPFFSFFYKEVINRRTISQGFLVETNDMHGKIKSQLAYSESDEKTPLSASYHTYANTGRNGMNDKFDFVYNEEGGVIRKGNMGVDVELMTDAREFSVMSNGFNGQIQIDLYTFGPITIPLPTFFPLKTYIENKYKAVTCTKLVNYHAIEDSVIVMDKGSVISTKVLTYDSETGTPIVTRTRNEFNDSIFTVNYPAFWAYSGTGPAYRNIGRQFKNVNFLNGRIVNGNANITSFESGDELYITQHGTAPSSNCVGNSSPVTRLWAIEKSKNSTSLTQTDPDIMFIDSAGYPYNRNGVAFRIIRSGKRNNLGLSIGQITLMKNPVRDVSGTYKLRIDTTSKVVSASAVLLKEKWQADEELFVKKTYYKDTCSDVEMDSINCGGILQKNINPYLKGLIGNLKPWRSYVFYGERNESDPSQASAIRKNGYMKAFGYYWNYDGDNLLVPNHEDTRWVWNSEITKLNNKGQELETRDPLNRYTAAQYGFNKTIPVAVMQNSRYGESFAEGFEDYGYRETINNASEYLCPQKYIDLSSLTNSKVVNTDTTNFRAHTGKFVLKVDSNSHADRAIGLRTAVDSFRLLLEDSTKTIITTGNGSVLSRSSITPVITNFTPYCTTTSGNLSMTATQVWGSTPDHSNLKYDESTIQYTRVMTSGNYTFNLHASITNTYLSGPPDNLRSGLLLKITNVATGDYYYRQVDNCLSCGDNSTDESYVLFLECGVYKLEGFGYAHFFGTDGHAQGSQFSYSCSALTSYAGTTCSYTRAVAAKDSMLTPTKFTVVPGKRMQFSAWVREECGNATGTPCFKTKYEEAYVKLTFTGSATSPLYIRTSGPIIEGWQKAEKEFTVPMDATGITLQFYNEDASKAYFDDIRIHPFNSNMKSYVYNPQNLRLSAELDENNHAAFYEYDEEGQLVRVKKETIEGIKTIKETRSATQRGINDVQQY